jgi:hypothetical protein
MPENSNGDSAAHFTDHQELKAFWLRRVLQCQRQYFDAVEHHKRLKEENDHTFLGDETDHEVAGFVVARARRAEALALAEFLRVANLYRKVVLNGVVPPDDDATVPWSD